MSELDFAVDDTAELLVIDPTGKRTGFDAGTDMKEISGSDYARDSIDNDATDEAAAGVTHSLGIFQPVQGPYTAVLTGLKLGTFKMTIRAFSDDGSAQLPLVAEGIAGPKSMSRFTVKFASTPGASSKVARFATLQSTLTDISTSRQLGLINNDGTANLLAQKIQSISQATGAARIKILNAFKNEVNAQSGKHISGIALQVLLQDGDSLLTQNP